MSKNEYYRVLLRRDRDRELITWLESERKIGERPGVAIRRKLYRLLKKGDQR